MILITNEAIIGINVTTAKTPSSIDPIIKIWRPLAKSKAIPIKAKIVALDKFVGEPGNRGTRERTEGLCTVLTKDGSKA